MVDFKDLIITSLLSGLFLIAMISGISLLQIQNNANNTLLEDDAMNRTFIMLGGNLSASQGQAEGAKEGFEEEIPTLGTDSFLFSSIIAVGKIFTGMWRNVYDIVFGLAIIKLGISPIVIGVIITIIISVVVLLAWRVYKAGG